MKSLLCFGASLSVVSVSLLGMMGNANAANLFQNGDSLSGSSSPDGLFGIALSSVPGPARNYFGTKISGGLGISLPNGPNFNTYASITAPSSAPTQTAATYSSSLASGATGGFASFQGQTGQFRSFVSQPLNFVVDFLTYNVSGTLLQVDLNGVIKSNTGSGGAINFEVPVLVTKTLGANSETVDGIFKFTTQNISTGFPLSPTVVDPGDGKTNIVFTGGQTYSWELDVVNIPEPSGVTGLLVLGVLGGGVVLKRKLLK